MRILRKYDYPFDKQEKATQTVLEQAEVLSAVVTRTVAGPGQRRVNQPVRVAVGGGGAVRS